MYQDQPPPVNRYSKPVDNYNNAPYPPNQPYYDSNQMPTFNNGPPPVDRGSRMSMLQPDPQYYQQPNMMPNQPAPPPVNRASRVYSTPPPSQYMHGGADQYNPYQPPPQYPPQVPMHDGGSAYPQQPTAMPPMPAHHHNNRMPPPQYPPQPMMHQHMPPHQNIPPQTMPPTNNYSAPPPQINISSASESNPQYVPVMLPTQQQPPRPMSVPAPMTNDAPNQHVPQIVMPGPQTNNSLAPNPAAPKRRNTIDPSAIPAIDNLNLSPRNSEQPSPTKKPLPKIPLPKTKGPLSTPKSFSAPTTPSIQSPVEEKPVQPVQPAPKQPVAVVKAPPGNAKPKSPLVMRVPKQPPPPMPPSDAGPPPRPNPPPPTVPDKPVEESPPPRPLTSPRAQTPVVYEEPLPALPKSGLPQNMTEGRDYKYYESGESLIVKKAMRGWKYREEARKKVKLGKNQIVLFVGDANCGKTAAIKAKLGSFPTQYTPSTFDMTKVKLDGNEVELWDIGDHPDMVSKLNLCFPVACCIVIVFALDNPDSFRNVKLKWVPWAREKNAQAPILLMGTKLDLMTPEERNKHQPEHTERCQYAEKIDGCYVEGSAKTMEGFGEVFDIILTMLCSLAKKKPAK